MNTTQSNTQNQSTTTVAKRKVKIDSKVAGMFGNGRLSPAMEELFKDSIRLLGFNELQAYATAEQFGKDFGQALADGKVTVKYGNKVDKAGKMTLKEVTETLKVVAKWTLNIGSVCSQLDAARKVGLKVINVTMTDEIMEFVNNFADRIEKE